MRPRQLQSNEFIGKIPVDVLTQLTELRHLDLRNNLLSAAPRDIPSFFVNWCASLVDGCFYDDTQQPADEADKAALLALAGASDVAQWNNNAGWSTPGSDPCQDGWFGVTCDGIGFVHFVNLEHNGALPTNSSALPLELLEMDRLVELNLDQGGEGEQWEWPAGVVSVASGPPRHTASSDAQLRVLIGQGGSAPLVSRVTGAVMARAWQLEDGNSAYLDDNGVDTRVVSCRRRIAMRRMGVDSPQRLELTQRGRCDTCRTRLSR